METVYGSGNFLLQRVRYIILYKNYIKTLVTPHAVAQIVAENLFALRKQELLRLHSFGYFNNIIKNINMFYFDI